jgi:hypothetical protein
MKRFPIMLFLCLAFGLPSSSSADTPKPDALKALHWLQGHWVGTGDGEPGISAADRRISCTLKCRYLRVKGRSVYPKQEKNPKGEIHDSMDMWSFDRARKILVLRTFDSMGFTTTYAQDQAASTETRVILVAEHLENVPSGWKARYTYTFIPPDEFHELFELDPDGKGFQSYSSNRFMRVSQRK